MPTAYITHPDCLRHEMGMGHPECPERLHALNDALRGSSLNEDLTWLQAPLAEADDLKRVHRGDYVDMIFANAPREGYLRLDPDTAMNPHSLMAARRAAGAGILAVEEVMAGRCRNAFCAVRPCGHHATQGRPMGFCIFNNIAVAAAYALEEKALERVAVIDFDVHHGNGTEDIFSAEKWHSRVLMTSFFQHPFYPYSGTSNPAPNMINIPLAAGSGGTAAKNAFTSQWLPALHAFQPQMILISAGFDAHRDDLLGGMALNEEDYAWLTRELMAVADQYAEQRIVSMLEGGYNLDALGRSAVAHIESLASQR
jgi:acetoin utilization deacetylase AcuC-like enzyme